MMNIGRRGAELIAQYQRSIAEEARALNRLDGQLREGCHDLGLIASLSQEVFAAHAWSVSIYMKLQKYRYDRNMGIQENDS